MSLDAKLQACFKISIRSFTHNWNDFLKKILILSDQFVKDVFRCKIASAILIS